MAYKIPRLGWLPDPLDARDLTTRDPEVVRTLQTVMPRLSPRGAAAHGVPSPTATPGVGRLRVDLRRWCPPVEDQGEVGSCTANAVVGALEYFERRTVGEHTDASRFFLYRATRRLLGWEGRGDTGAFIRSTIQALRIFGVPPEEYWPYKESDFDREPEAFQYAFAQRFRAVQYFRVEETVSHLRSALDAGLPFAFGFSCFESMFTPEVERTGVIPYPAPRDRLAGGHAVLAVGYTDSHVLIRNSWGERWGLAGYGFLPWTFFDQARPLATDCWALVRADFLADDARTGAPRDTTPLAIAPGPRAAPPPPERALVQVVRGTDPLDEVPVHVTPEGVAPLEAGLRVGLRATTGRVSLELQGLRLTEDFDLGVLGEGAHEVYLVALAWDLSGRPPELLPDPLLGALAQGVFHRDDGTAGELRFGEERLTLWHGAPVVGALYVRLLLVESGQGPDALRAHLGEVQARVRQSALTLRLAELPAAPTLAALARVAEEAQALTGTLAEALRDRDAAAVVLLQGAYGADTFLRARTDAYHQLGVVLDLCVSLEERPRAAGARSLSAVQQMQLALAEARLQASTGASPPGPDGEGPAAEPAPPPRTPAPHA